MDSFVIKLIGFVTKQAGSPHQLAAGVALGLWVGLTFPPGTQMIVAVALASIFQCNSILAAAATWITNPLTMPVIYPAQIALGCLLAGIPLHEIVPGSLLELRELMSSSDYPLQILVLFFLGSQATGIALSAVGYYVTWEIARRPARREQPWQYPGREPVPPELHPQILIKIMGEEGISLTTPGSRPKETAVRKNGKAR
ncbi:MAG TPA: DUF2062 domain-containing protein [bacterium]|nr:DUF2062 domain-containing protein [bacterium]